ncbi:MAG TPA: C/D box methylation guide ribonucleoprotein complex aNOP56 subunit [Methylomirabilota bacterium]|nr:C/D box methylation guide ribonucleoprotein complex aNOP56 subunit [Methylomirabilota bacterium]
MEVYVIETPVGVFIVDDKLNVLDKVLFAKAPHLAAAELKQLQEGNYTTAIIDALRNSGKTDTLVFENQLFAKAAERANLQATTRTSPVVDTFRSRLSSEWVGRDAWIEQQSLTTQIFRTPDAYNDFARQITLEIARAGIASAATRRDLSAVQAVRSIDDLDKTLNLLAGRVREWYGLHFPEMDRIVEKHDTYARLIAKLGNRRNFTKDNLVGEGIPSETADTLAEAARRSMGGQIEEVDLQVLKSFCDLMLELYKFRGKSEAYIDDVLKQVAPNMTAVVGAPLSARLISIAGSLDNLAKMPASTLQVLGAEKALFRSLKTGARPPKHGVIFQHTAIHQSPRWQRGKIARALSGKLSIAARVDAFGGTFVGEQLRDNVNKKVDEIKDRYKTPPPSPQARQQKKRDLAHKR